MFLLANIFVNSDPSYPEAEQRRLIIGPRFCGNKWVCAVTAVVKLWGSVRGHRQTNGHTQTGLCTGLYIAEETGNEESLPGKDVM